MDQPIYISQPNLNQNLSTRVMVVSSWLVMTRMPLLEMMLKAQEATLEGDEFDFLKLN